MNNKKIEQLCDEGIASDQIVKPKTFGHAISYGLNTPVKSSDGPHAERYRQIKELLTDGAEEPQKDVVLNEIPDDDEPQNWRELAEACLLDMESYCDDEHPSRRRVSAEGYRERFNILDRALSQPPRGSVLAEECFARFGELVYDYLRNVVNDDWWGDEWSEDIMPLAVKSGLATREEYDPDAHGGDIEAEPGDEIWVWTPLERAAHAPKEG